MEEQNNLLQLVISNKNFEKEKEYIVNYKFEIGLTHLDCFHDFYEKNNIVKPGSETDLDYAKDLAAKGIVVFLNSGLKINDKILSICILPESLELNQIDFFDKYYKKYLTEECPYKISTAVLTSNKVDYRSNIAGCRDLKIESIIDSSNINDSIELLFKEIQRHSLMKKQAIK